MGRRKGAGLALGLALILTQAGCTRSSGGDSGVFKVVSVNIRANESDVPLNQGLEVRFSTAVDEASLNASSLSVSAVSKADPAGPDPRPFVGTLFLKDSQTVFIQPNCPTLPDLSDAGFPPSMNMELSVSDSLKSLGGTGAEEFKLSFTTRSTVGNPFAESLPGQQLAALGASSFPALLKLNALSDPNEPLEIRLNKPIDAINLPADAVKMRFEAAPGVYYPVPLETLVVENCNEDQQAVLAVTILGILPPANVEMFLSSELSALGGEVLGQDQLLAAFAVSPKGDLADNTEPDSILEGFTNNDGEDRTTPLPAPRAQWGLDGNLHPASPFPGAVSDKDIEIGPNTANGVSKTVDTSFATLIATDGSVVSVVDGQVYCRNFSVFRDNSGNGKHGRLEAVGPNPLVINASGTVFIERQAKVEVQGQDAPGVFTVGTANVPEPGAAGRGTGGDGGDGSPNTSGSSAKGNDGNGPFNVPGTGGKGGHSAYGAIRTFEQSCIFIQTLPGGGGAGAFIVNENMPDGDDDPFDSIDYVSPEFPDADQMIGYRYGRFDDTSSKDEDDRGNNCSTNGTQTGPDLPPCHGSKPATNTRAEPGTGGPTGRGSDNLYISTNDPNDPGRVDIFDAVTGTRGAQGGAISDPVFTNLDGQDDFFGTQVFVDPVYGLTYLEGELNAPQGGAGGGAGGDSVNSPSWPPGGTYNFIQEDVKGAGGAGGGGVFWVRALQDVLVDGEISVDGGDGGFGENYICIAQGGGGSGAGAGGMVILESQSSVQVGTRGSRNPKVHANGGNRGMGSSRKTNSERCRQIDPCIDGINNWVPCCKNKPDNNGIPAHSFRNSRYAGGGAGSKGLQQIHVPHNDDGTVVAGALKVLGQNISGVPRVVDAPEDEFFPNKRIDPDFLILLPTFGYKSAALSEWKYLGWQNTLLPENRDVAYSFGGTDASGVVDFSAAPTVLASGSGGAVLDADGLAITIANQALADLYAANPKALIFDRVQSAGGESHLIVNATQEADGSLKLFFDAEEPAGAGEDFSTWEIQRTYLHALNVDANTEVRVQFQGAAETSPGSGVVDPATLTDLTPDPADLANLPFIRFQITINADVNGLIPDPAQVAAFGIKDFKVPFRF